MKLNPYQHDDSTEELCRQILTTARADQDEIEAAANSPFLFQRIRNQIAAEGSASHQRTVLKNQSFFSLLFASLNWRWAVPVLTVVIIGSVMMTNKFNSGMPKPNQLTTGAAPKSAVPNITIEPSGYQLSNPSLPETPTVKASYRPTMKHAQNRISHSRITKVEVAEEVTDFLPLTYLAEAAATDSGHVVRVEVPRAMMASMGVPTNLERRAEFVKADVIIGDDGLARAIRFVQ